MTICRVEMRHLLAQAFSSCPRVRLPACQSMLTLTTAPHGNAGAHLGASGRLQRVRRRLQTRLRRQGPSRCCSARLRPASPKRIAWRMRDCGEAEHGSGPRVCCYWRAPACAGRRDVLHGGRGCRGMPCARAHIRVVARDYSLRARRAAQLAAECLLAQQPRVRVAQVVQQALRAQSGDDQP